jgi:apolipoprotein D and lipocalin family protein
LSRTKDIERAYVDKIRNKLQSAGVNIFDLSIINQANCPKITGESRINVDINPDTFSSQNIGSWVRTAGEKIGDGVEWAVDKTKKIYKTVTGDSNENSSERNSRLSEKPAWMP